MAKYLDDNGLLYFWQKIKLVFSSKAEGVKTITRDGTTFTVTRADDTTFTFTQQDSTVAKTTTTPKAPGTAAIGSETKYAAGDHVHPHDSTKVDVVEGKGLSTEDYTTAEKTKLSGIAAGAEVNQNAFSSFVVDSTTIAADSKTDSLEIIAGSNVTLTPNATNDTLTIAATDTVTTATTSGDGNAVTAITASNGALTVTKGSTFILSSAKGAASGICPLNASSKIDSQYLPSFVDDVVEAYARSGQTALSQNWLATGSASGTVISPEAGKIYVLMNDTTDYSANSQFRWSGSTYIKLSDGGISAISNAEIDTILAA